MVTAKWQSPDCEPSSAVSSGACSPLTVLSKHYHLPTGKEALDCELQEPSAIHVRNHRAEARISLLERPLNGEKKREVRVASRDERVCLSAFCAINER